MRTLLDPPPKVDRSQRRGLLSDNEEVRSVQAGLILTLIVWPLIIWVLSVAMRHLGHNGPSRFAPAPKPSFSIELMPDIPIARSAPTPPRPPDKFVETNPDAPENVPDKTRNFAARNQQVAQEKPSDDHSDTPQIEGKKEDREVTQIIDGRLQKPEDQPPPEPPPTPQVEPAEAQAEARKEQNPLPGTEKIEGDNKNGFGANVGKTPDNASAIPDKIEGQKNAPEVFGKAQSAQPKIDPNRPLPRPRVDKNVRPAVLVENKFGTSNIGPTAVDARWSQYGQYLQQLIETVQIQWERIIEQSHVYPPNGTSVQVKFRIDSTGAIAEILHSESSGGTQAERACISAITARAPYGKWTDDMIALLGESQDMTFTFYYH